jgi:dipeptidyl aminopeptidase/acylaminoacyl peptidase
LRASDKKSPSWKQRFIAIFRNRHTKSFLLLAQSVCPFKAVLLTAVLLSAATLSAKQGNPQLPQRDVTVKDGIEMARLADPLYLAGSSRFSVASFSPDGTRFIIVLTKGDLEHNTNRYSVLLFKTSMALSSSKPEILLTMSSSSNREAIRNLRWLPDNDTIAFIAENLADSPQVYIFNIQTRALNRETNHPTPVVAFDISETGDKIIFEADPPTAKLIETEQVRRTGIVVTTQLLRRLLAGDCYTFVPTLVEGEQVFLKVRGQPSVRISLEDIAISSRPPSMSPNGQYALIEAFVRHVPEGWRDYQNKLIHDYATEDKGQGSASILRRYLLIDVRNRRASPLLDAPLGFDLNGFAWAPDGQSVVISGAYLPLDSDDAAERTRRVRNTFIAEVKLPSRSIVVVSEKQLRVSRWDRDSHRVLLEPDDSVSDLPVSAYEKKDAQWNEVSVSPRIDVERSNRLRLTLEEDCNTPPKIYATDRGLQHRRLVLDLNPQFDELRFGRVEEVIWTATDGHKVAGGLYLPPDYIPGRRYPLVIQTHGFDKKRFKIDGPWGSAFAARPLAAEGIVVLQVGGSPEEAVSAVEGVVNTPREAPYRTAEFEGAIDYLDEKGLIDRNRVGIIGFSRTVHHVEYALTHSTYPFAAATVADGINAGYFSYVEFPNGGYEMLNGGPPFGDTLTQWIKNSPGFSLDKVHTPVRIEYYGSSTTVLGGWEWFSILSRLHKPADLIYLPNATHELVKPWELLTSQEGNVDWFRFWLKGGEDPDPTKIEQYIRWHHFRELEEQDAGNLGTKGNAK